MNKETDFKWNFYITGNLAMTNDIWETLAPRFVANASNPAWVRRVKDGPSQKYSYSQVYEGALHLAGKLRQHGIGRRDVVCLIGPNSPQWGVAALAVWKIGAILAPVHIGNSVDDIHMQLGILNPKMILAHESGAKLEGVEFPILEIEIGSELMNEELAQPQNHLSSEEALRIYTSGSTGVPKIVRLSHRNITSNFVACSKIVEIDHSDRFLSLLPLSHTFELVGGMMLPLFCGASIALPKVLSAQEVLAAMAEEDVTVVLAVPRLFRNIKVGMEKKFQQSSFLLRGYLALLAAVPLGLRTRLNAPLKKKLGPKLRYWVSGGSRLDPTIAQFFRNLGISLRQGYGLSETSPVVCVQEAFPKNFDSVGYAIEGVEVKIKDPDEFGSGEVLVTGNNVMLGYLDADLTKEVMEGQWFKTGDIGRLDARGNLSLTGRIKRVIITEAGKNVYPEELETLLERFDGVKEAGVIEVSQRPCAVLAMDNPGQSGARAKQIVKEFNSKASSHNQITKIAVVEELPRTPLGKTALTKLNDEFEANELK